jgi:hypothetical protein
MGRSERPHEGDGVRSVGAFQRNWLDDGGHADVPNNTAGRVIAEHETWFHGRQYDVVFSRWFRDDVVTRIPEHQLRKSLSAEYAAPRRGGGRPVPTSATDSVSIPLTTLAAALTGAAVIGYVVGLFLWKPVWQPDMDNATYGWVWMGGTAVVVVLWTLPALAISMIQRRRRAAYLHLGLFLAAAAVWTLMAPATAYSQFPEEITLTPAWVRPVALATGVAYAGGLLMSALTRRSIGGLVGVLAVAGAIAGIMAVDAHAYGHHVWRPSDILAAAGLKKEPNHHWALWRAEKVLERGLRVQVRPVTSGRVRRSRGGTSTTELAFVNATSTPARLIWRDRKGRSRPFGIVAPWAEREFTTYVGDAWRVRLGKHSVGTFVAPRRWAIAIIRNRSVAP